KVLIFLIPAGLTFMFGKMVGNVRQGWAVFAAMSTLFLAGATVCVTAEKAGNPAFSQYGVSVANMEGKEVRFGSDASA
ncbi:potassium-transporting ATPase subunit KdpA, partial [Acinetobacter baumannii]